MTIPMINSSVKKEIFAQISEMAAVITVFRWNVFFLKSVFDYGNQLSCWS